MRARCGEMGSSVLTVAVEDRAQARFEALRQKYYPPALNRIGAHVTLFHNLPMTDDVQAELMRVAKETVGFTARVEGLQFLGRGVALKVGSEELLALHARLARAFEEVLIRQDRQKFRPHVVVQNKVTAELARGTMRELEGADGTFACVGLDWWEYLGGPWRLIERLGFGGE